MPKFNDIDEKLWRDYSDVETGSLWLIDKRDNSGVHVGDYHGNFVPQIPHQLFTRYTKKNDWILDPFMGSGTSLIEAQRMKRNAVGIELQQKVLEETMQRISLEENSESKIISICGDSGTVDIKSVMNSAGIKNFQFVIFHPPYWDIIKFSDNPQDLSNCTNLEDFKNSFGKIIDNTTRFLEKNRYCACVIGDKYSDSRVIPLGFYCMELFMEKNFLLKAVIVKNFGETKGKNNHQNLWRYRALKNDFYIFKHEYIFVFKKNF
ncbi:MAG: hypothetical protein IK062_01525 [Selenomonadaceae bacterium]|nr:hypothetical protein [Selenomonadaceae bacterium]